MPSQLAVYALDYNIIQHTAAFAISSNAPSKVDAMKSVPVYHYPYSKTFHIPHTPFSMDIYPLRSLHFPFNVRVCMYIYSLNPSIFEKTAYAAVLSVLASINICADICSIK